MTEYAEYSEVRKTCFETVSVYCCVGKLTLFYVHSIE